MAPLEKPTLLFVSGAWHTPQHFKPIRTICEAKGYPTECPLLRTIEACPPTNLMDDAEQMRELLKKLIEDECKDVLIICHSYGGLVTSQAADADFSKESRATKGLDGGIIRIIFMAAFIMSPGQALVDAYGGSLPSCFPIDKDGRMSVGQPGEGGSMLYHDMPQDEQDHWATELRRSSRLCPVTPITQAGHLYHPMAFIFTERDRPFPIDAQRALIKTLRLENDVEIHTETLDSDHSPFLSQPHNLVDLIARIAAM